MMSGGSDNEPFGPVDGGTPNSGEFVEFNDPGLWGDLALTPADRRARILVGRRGSGKSRYLARLQVDAADDLIIYPQRNTLISLPHLKWLHRTYSDKAERIEKWRDLWQRAIHGGISLFVLNHIDNHFTINIDDSQRKTLQDFCRQMFGVNDAIVPIVKVLDLLLERNQDRSKLDRILAEPHWFKIFDTNEKIIARSTPIAAFIDILDENFGDAPAASVDMQLGLVTYLLSELLDDHAANRLHIVITIRDIVYSSMLRLDNGQRYNRRQNIRLLDWTKESAQYFLVEKIKQLRPHFICGDPNARSSIERWLGITKIKNVARNDHSEEPIDEYILRHTRFLPRDIVQIGNNISSHIRKKSATDQKIDPDEIRQYIKEEARTVARRALDAVFNNIIAMDDEREVLTTDVLREYKEKLEQGWREGFLETLGKEKFDSQQLRRAEQAFQRIAAGWMPSIQGVTVKLSDMLWQHGLLGYESETSGQTVVKYFHSSGGLSGDSEPALPTESFYFIHSSILDIATLAPESTPPLVKSFDPSGHA